MEHTWWDVAAGSIAALTVMPAPFGTVFPGICPVGFALCSNTVFVCLPLRAVQLTVLHGGMLIKFNSKP